MQSLHSREEEVRIFVFRQHCFYTKLYMAIDYGLYTKEKESPLIEFILNITLERWIDILLMSSGDRT